MNLIAGSVVVTFGLCLIGFAVVIVIKPLAAERFLNSFAGSARAHYTEQTIRLLAGIGLVVFAPSMWHPEVFSVFGWLIVVTAVALLLVPWQWHHRFGKWAIPLATRNLKLYAVGVFTLGSFILYGASRPLIS